jgi:hypothetical protein
MKKNLPLCLIAFFIVLFSTKEITAQTRLLHYWHFNNTLPTSGAGGTHFGTNKMNSDYTKPSVTTGYLRYVKVPTCVADTGYCDNIAGDSINQRPGYGACCPLFGATVNNSGVRMRNPSDSMQFLWYIPTNKFKNIKLTWEAMASSAASGQHRMNYSYSLDSGVTFITTNLPKLFDSAATAWGKISLNLSSILTINNNNKFMLRIKFSAPNTGTSGNNRFDNLTVEGDTNVLATGISEIESSTNGYQLYPNPSSEQIYISCPNTNVQNIVITNIMGQVVFVSEQFDSFSAPLDISKFTNGIYFVRVCDKTGENKATLKFVKN